MTRKPLLLAAALATGGALAVAVPAAYAQPGAPAATPVQDSLTALVRDNPFPGALAAVRGRDGRTRDYTAGVGELKTHAKVPVDGQVRIGSNTKVFTAVVVLQLVGEGKVSLDAPVDTYLPGLLRGDGIDGRTITVRQLLQHTSGLPNYTAYIPNIFQIQHTYFEPTDLVKLALQHPADFAPGTKWEYSNTNYAVAALLAEKVSGRPIGELITNRIVKPLGLKHTYWPSAGDQTIRETHPHGYEQRTENGPLEDATEQDPSRAWAAGQMNATPSDLNRFFRALLDGKLLKPAELQQMQTTVPVTEEGFPAGARYGLGLIRYSLSCGGYAWGHGGDINGYETRNAATTDGRAATVAVTALPATLDQLSHVFAAVDGALCH
jgi:D-alanyl-D-alanine carboxypeptidase